MIGDLRTRIGLYAPTTTPDGAGGQTKSWTFQRAVWAHVEPGNVTRGRDGSPDIRAHRVTIRHIYLSLPARLMWGERTLRVTAASDPDLRRERLHLICEEDT